ncbi:3-oxoacyl-[acyl-carrier-protein] reductase [Maledivibacter halophilus]|uniref:3-oxoacyl-[acyl-carrier-protein] reductase n=1 Tax=Maledivibacter halophilus TaxID=36842 RepID=A0A1T5LKP9_9FIRM|nr:3-oxoacyl-[acyl-carrier-protein] reductase [Maledivibacter halophilus]SKC76454.1 3-oxoacyl-[acyl-carrier-protein] reductase [Maledivibacter halophilus]
MKLEGKVAFVTGGSRGIGRAISIKMAEKGANVVVGYKNNTMAAQSTIDEIDRYSVKSMKISLDISKNEEVIKTVDRIINKFGKIDILVNNAGITRDSMLQKMNIEQWHEVLNSNLNSVYFCTKAVVSHMLKRRYGKIINITSLGAFYGNVGQVNYCSSKAGIVGFTKSLAAELGKKGICVNAVGPGCIKTDMLMQVPQKVLDKMIKRIPLKRLGEGEDVASAVVFLASDDSEYIVGQTIIVDGGLGLSII